MYGVPSAFVAGRTGLPNESTDAIVGFAPALLVAVLILPFAQPSQYRKMPFLAQSVSTAGLIVFRWRSNCWPQRAKKNVLFFTMGPPRLAVYSFRLIQAGLPGVQTPRTICLLLLQVFASSAEFRTFHTALPRNSFVPERVMI